MEPEETPIRDPLNRVANYRPILTRLRDLENDQHRRRLADQLENVVQLLEFKASSSRNLSLERLQEYRDQSAKGTCRWLLNHHKYMAWLHAENHDGSRVLWLSGKAGVGKSVAVATTAAINLPESGEGFSHHVDTYFFCKGNVDTVQNGRQIMLHLLMQLLGKLISEVRGNPSGDNVLLVEKCLETAKGLKIQGKTIRQDQNSQLETSHLVNIFREIGRLLDKTIFVILDAIDEYPDGSCEELLSAILGLAKDEKKFRLLLSSRPESDVNNMLLADAAIKHPRIVVNESLNGRDISAYLDDCLDALSADGRVEENEQQQIREYILSRAAGMFRYATLATKSLEESKSTRELKEAVYNLRYCMNEFYAGHMKAFRERDREWLLTTLRWVICGRRGVKASVIADDLERTFSRNEDTESDGDKADEGADQTNPSWISNSPPCANIEKGAGNMPRTALRPSIKWLKRFARDFFIVDSEDELRLQHHSISTWVQAVQAPEHICDMCLKQFRLNSPFEAAPKYGHLLQAASIMRTLNNGKFQGRFLSGETSVPEQVIKNDRYELQHWDFHVRRAEAEWLGSANDNPGKYYQDAWYRMQEDVEAFMNDECPAFKVWRDRRWPSRWPVEVRHSPLFVSAQIGLLVFMKKRQDELQAPELKDRNDCTPLHLLCYGDGDFAGLEFVLQAQPKAINERNVNGDTPLLLAMSFQARGMRTEDVLMDRQYIARPDIPNNKGYTALHLAAARNDLEGFRKLMACKDVDLNVVDENGETPLYWALRREDGSKEIAKALIDHEKVHVCAKNTNDQSPLHLACRLKDASCAEKLLRRNTRNINDVENELGCTPLHMAVDIGNIELVKKLIEYGADSLIEDKYMKNSIAKAGEKKHIEILEFLLLKHREKTPEMDFWLYENDDGSTVLHYWALVGFTDVLRVVLKNHSDAPQICNHENKNGVTMLDLAVQHSHYDTVKVLLENGAVASAKDRDGRTPLQLVLDQLVSKDLDEKRKYLQTIMLLADHQTGSGGRLSRLVADIVRAEQTPGEDLDTLASERLRNFFDGLMSKVNQNREQNEV